MSNIDFDERSGKHEKRVQRLGAHKLRTVEMSRYLAGAIDDPRYESLPDQLRDCHTYLLFHDHYEEGVIRLHRTISCRKHLLCPLCAILRAANGVQRYHQRYEVIKEGNDSLRLYYVVLTVKNGDDLQERFAHVEKAMRKLVKRRREAISAREGKKSLAYALGSVFANVEGGAYSFEVKRGVNSGEWHPHVNILLLSSIPIDGVQLVQEWKEITGDSFITYCEEKPGDDKTVFVEVFKYAMKFSEMSCDDTFRAYQVLRKRRLFGSFGVFRGVVVPKDPECDIESPYVELVYRWYQNRYQRDASKTLVDCQGAAMVLSPE